MSPIRRSGNWAAVDDNKVEAQTPLLRSVVDLLDNKSCNKLYKLLTSKDVDLIWVQITKYIKITGY